MKISETEIIALLKSKFTYSHSHILGIGDDAALIKINDQEALVTSKDLLIEDSHFRLKYFSPQAIAHKSLHSNFSDLAAMGVKPEFVLLGLALPPKLDMEWIKQFTDQVANICNENSVIVLGGDTVFSTDKLMISVTINGIGKLEHIKYLNHAVSGDVLCVAGNLGYAHLGFIALEQELPSFQFFKDKQLFPKAKIAEGIFLGHHPEVSAMTDISDGLSQNLSHMCQASKVGAIIDLNHIPCSDDLQNLAVKLNISPLDAIIHGGEDYGLLFTIPANLVNQLAAEFYQKFSYNFHKIGIITKTQKIIYR